MGKKEGILKRMIDVDYRLMGMALNKLKSQANALFNLKRGFILRILDKNVRKMGEAQRVLRMNAYELNQAEMKLKKKQEEWELRMKTGILNRIMNNGIRYQSMAWRSAIEWTKFEREKEEKELRLKKKVCMMLVNSNYRLAVKCMNALKEWRNLALLDDEK